MQRRVTEADSIIGAKIRLRRKELGLSQGDLGARLGIAFQQIQKYEAGTNRVGAARLVEISKILQVPTSYFFDDPCPGNVGIKLVHNVLQLEGAPELLVAYARISDPLLRRSVLTLARNLARVDVPEAGPEQEGQSTQAPAVNE